MGNYKEIVTKAILDKTQKDVNLEYTLPMNEPIDNVLGCWVINHKFNGSVFNNSVVINGEYDINIWYSYNGNSKTNVIIKNFTYQEQMDMNLNNSHDTEVIVKCLNQPSVVDVNIENNNIILKVESIMGVEIIGNTSLKVSVLEDMNNNYDSVNYPEINTNYLK